MAKIYKWSNITMSALSFLKYQYWFHQSIIKNHLCDRIIEEGERELQKLKAKGESTIARTFGRKEEVEGDTKAKIGTKTYEEMESDGINPEDVSVRKTEVAWLSAGTGHQWLFDLINPIIHEANRKAEWNFQIDSHEPGQFTKYPVGGYYGWHADNNPLLYKKPDENTPKDTDGNLLPPYTADPIMWGKYRKISVTVNITPPDQFDGGDLKFDFGPHWGAKKRFHLCEEIRPRGSIIIFPSSLHHQVTPVTRGTRYSLVVWYLGQPFK